MVGDFDEYIERFLAALYLDSEDSGGNYASAQKIHQKYGFAPDKDHWISRMADEWEYRFFKDVSKVIGGYDGWSFRLSPDGYRHVEENFRDIDEIREYFSQPHDPSKALDNAQIRDTVEVGTVPAANRLVRLDHNQPEWREVARGLDDLFEQVRGNNQIGETAEERDRLLKSLTAAQRLWSAAELYLVQIRVGVVMAIEDATNAAAKIGKAVGGALVVDLIKRIIKQATGIDF